MVLIKGMKDILVNSQKSCASHPKLTKNLLNIYLKSDFEEFLKDFTYYLKFLLIHGEKEAVIERSLTFVSKFATSVKTENENQEEVALEENDDVDPLLVDVFNFLLKNHDANSKAVRYRVCYLINKLLNNMGEQASIDDDLYSTIYDTMLQRLMDKIPAIRVQAILALARLQDPVNKECPVIKAYRYHLSMDPNSDVRKAVLSNIAITFQTLPDVLERVRDVKDLVRRQAYLMLAQKVHIRSFTIAQRLLLISDGLNDRSPGVRLVVKKNLLQSWLRLVDGKILDLLACLDVETSTESAQLALQSMFEDVSYSTLLENFSVLKKNRLIDIADLKPEAAFCWKCLAKHLKNEKAYDHLDELLPDLSSFCDYINDYIQTELPTDIDQQESAVLSMQKEFIIQQLLSTTLVFDLSDEVGRTNLGLLTRKLLLKPSFGESCIATLCKIFENLYPENIRINNVAEIISDLREVQPEQQQGVIEEPILVIMTEEEQRKHKLKIAKNSVNIFQLREELEECVRSLNLEKAQELKIKLKELEEIQQMLAAEATRTPKASNPQNAADILEPRDEEEIVSNDPDILVRCLTILCQTLSSSDISSVSSTIRSLHDNLILPCLSSEIPSVRKNAIHALANVCLLSLDLSKQHILLFIRISQIDTEEIQIVALKAVFDFLHLYGLEEFFNVAESIFALPGFTVEESSPSVDINSSHSLALGNMIGSISKILDSESSELRTLVAEGFAKLLLSSRISSPKLFAHLIIMWFNPATEDDQLLRHMLGVFFPLYATRGADNAEVICQAFVPVVQTIFNAPVRSPISDIDTDDVCEFLISITNPRIVCSNNENGANVHDTLVFNLCAEVLAYPDRCYVKCLCHVMNKLSLTANNYPTLKQIDALCDKMIKSIQRDRFVAAKLEKFQKTVKSLLKNAPFDEIKKEKVDEEQVEEKIVDKSGRKRTLFNSTNVALELCEDISESEDSLFTDTEDISEPKKDIYVAEIPSIAIDLVYESNEEEDMEPINVVLATESESDQKTLAESSEEDETSLTTNESDRNTSSKKSKAPSVIAKRIRRSSGNSPASSESSSSTIAKKRKSDKAKQSEPVLQLRRLSKRSINNVVSAAKGSRRSSSSSNSAQSSRSTRSSISSAVEKKRKSSENSDRVYESNEEEDMEPINVVLATESESDKKTVAESSEEDETSLTTNESDRNTTSVKDTSGSSSDTVLEESSNRNQQRRRSSKKSKSPSVIAKRIRRRSGNSPASSESSSSPIAKKNKSDKAKLSEPVLQLRRLSKRSINVVSAAKGSRRSSSPSNSAQSSRSTRSSISSAFEKKRKSSENSDSKDSSTQESARKSVRLTRSTKKQGKK